MLVPAAIRPFDLLQSTTLTAERERELAARAEHALSFAIGEQAVCVRFSQASSARDFRRRYADMLVAGGSTPYVAYAVESADETHFWMERDAVWCHTGSRPDDAYVGFCVDVVACNEYLRRSHDAGFHAAVVASQRAAAAILGASTAGKSTTAIACVGAGLRLYSDERCIVQAGRVVPFLRQITLRRGGRALLADDPCACDRRMRSLLASWTAHEEVVFAPSEFAPGQVGGAPLPLACAFVLDGIGDAPRLEPAGAGDVAPAMLASMMSQESGLDRLARLLGILRGVTLYRLQLGAPGDTARVISETLLRDERRSFAR